MPGVGSQQQAECTIMVRKRKKKADTSLRLQQLHFPLWKQGGAWDVFRSLLPKIKFSQVLVLKRGSLKYATLEVPGAGWGFLLPSTSRFQASQVAIP